MCRCISVVAVLTLTLCLSLTVAGQDLEKIGKEKPVSVNGGVSLSQIVYAARGIDSRRDPYTYYAAGNVNVSLYGWSVPISFSYSNQQSSFQQPFNQYSLHPTYKYVTGHLGYVSMAFSPYTVNGHIFLGAGVDVAPEGPWKVSALYGRFRKAVEPDTTNDQTNEPAFKRMGYGVKATYGNDGSFVDVTLFHARDEVNSIRYVPDSLGVLPEENLVASIAAGKTLFDKFRLKAELASSALTRDVRSEEASSSQPLSKPSFLYTSRTSSAYYKAFKTSLDYQQEGYTVGVGYERVDPEYRTLGAYYFNNDLESITLNGTVALWENKMNISASGGTQRDNLDKSKISTMRRMVASVQVDCMPSEKLNISASYSTFQTYTNIRSQFVDINQLTPYDNLDTLDYTQISRNITATGSYMFGSSKDRRQTVNLNMSVQDAADKQADVTQNSGNTFYSVNASYAMNLVPQNLALSVAFNGNINDSPMLTTQTWGPTASVSKTFLDRRLRTTLSSSYNNSYVESRRTGSILNGRFSSTYTVQKKHNLNLSLVAVNRSTDRTEAASSFTEFTGTLGYSYAFGTK